MEGVEAGTMVSMGSIDLAVTVGSCELKSTVEGPTRAGIPNGCCCCEPLTSRESTGVDLFGSAEPALSCELLARLVKEKYAASEMRTMRRTRAADLCAFLISAILGPLGS